MRRTVLVSALAALLATAARGAVLVPVGATWRYTTGTDEPTMPRDRWRQVGYPAASWASGPSGFGFGDGDDATVVDLGACTTVAGERCVSLYLRHVFTVADPASVAGLQLLIDYDDGFVAYLNGVEVARRGLLGDPVTYTRLAMDREAGEAEVIPLSDAHALLVPGDNVLAIQVHDSAQSSTDLSCIPQLETLAHDPVARGPYLQRARPDSVLVRWRTVLPQGSTVWYGAPGVVDLVADDPTPTTEHEVMLTGLSPGTRYEYRVGGDGEVRTDLDPLRPLTFWTLPRSGSRSFDLAVVGDSGSGDVRQFAIGRRMREKRPDLVLHAGDLVYPSGEAEHQDQQVFSPYRELMAGACLFPSAGNHDLLTLGGGPWRDAFTTFANAPDRSETSYSFDVGHAHVLVLDSNRPVGDLVAGAPLGDWLRQDLAASFACWKLVVMHHVLYTSSIRFDQPDVAALRAELAPVFEALGVDVVLTGHVHAYERTYPIVAGVPVDQALEPSYVDPAGPIYVVTGGGGRPLEDGADGNLLTPRALDADDGAHHFVWVTLADGTLTLEARAWNRSATDLPLDQATITKTCAADLDGDTLLDAADNCPLHVNPAQGDLDADGQGDACDPDADGDGLERLDDCRDLDASLLRAPDEVAGLRVSLADASGPGLVRLRWADPALRGGTATTSQVLEGEISLLRNDRGFPAAACAAPTVSGAFAELPLQDGGRYWLVRASNACGVGTWGDSGFTPDPRDPLDGAGSPCP